MNISVKSVHFHADSKLVSHVEKKLSRLSRIYDRIVEVEVHLKLQDTGGKVQEKIAEVHLHIPGGWLLDKKTGQSFESAINASAETLKRQLTRYKEKMYGYEPEKITDRSPHA
ncbi:MAG: ribosome-associated translation inhibitor RaiA [Lewinellaceae bacterium]|nr:ribosome-associated translation inhibitor RaiA [Lewinellaceae bacterium]